MKIALCLPSFNEENNIANITRIADQGLTDFIKHRPHAEAIIINADSDSTDKTRELFSKTETSCPKISITTKQSRGKGTNILSFCNYAVNNQIDFCLTIDSDIVSATPDWVAKLLLPIVEQGFDFSTPIYQRSRFEGSSTNHFAFPLIYGITGHPIRQPIAGDFGFTREIAQAISSNPLSAEPYILSYGIDIFMTITALGRGCKISQVSLGKKIHSPSFNKLEYMFPQIANAMLTGLKNIPISKDRDFTLKSQNSIILDKSFKHKELANEMIIQAIHTLKNINSVEWIDSEAMVQYIQSFTHPRSEKKKAAAWVDVLTKWVTHFLNPNLSPEAESNAGKELLPFFELRAINFWFWAEQENNYIVESAIIEQADMVKDKLKIL